MATLKDVARESGLTVGTVSRVLNNRGYISEQTRERVYEVMKELNYQPNEMARSLSKQKSNTIGVIVPHIVHPYFAKLLSNLELAAYQYKYKLLLFNSKGKEDKEEEYIEMCKSNRVAGIILCSGSFHTEKFKNLDFPLVTIERFLNEGIAGIECDNYNGGILAAQHLIDRGCRHLLHIGGVSEQPMPADDRRQGFEEVCTRRGIEYIVVDTGRVFYDDMDYYSVIYGALKKYPRTDGIFASSDLIAAQTLQVCRAEKREVPRDIKIVGFDDVNVASLMVPGITTIRQPVREMADAAVAAVAHAAAGRMVPAKSVFPVSLVQRETT
ncbi:MAG: LacI family DNA-binding transcriptional regulator [Eubacteriales bacterium]|nr:LacI family DNA-binding transcriptional regulator [Eubacteriales bacterium]